MFRARALLDNPEPLSTFLTSLRLQRPLHLDVPIHSLLPHNVILPSQALQVHGLPGSGKTHLLYCLTIAALLHGDAVIVFDNDLKWDNDRLLHLLTHALPNEEEGLVRTRRDRAIELLDSVYIYQPASLSGFREDVIDLWRTATRDLPNHAVRYVLVDSISAFHWQSLADKSITTNEVYTALLKEVEKIGALLVVTSWNLGFQYLSLPSSVTLDMSKKYVLQFMQGLDQAVETKEHRMEVIRRGICYLTSEFTTERKTFIIKPDSCYFEG